MSARRPRLFLAACAIALGAACGDGTTATRDTARQALEARQREFTTALAARDTDRTAAPFAEDAVLHVANMPPVEGRDSIAQFYGNTFRSSVRHGARPRRSTLRTPATSPTRSAPSPTSSAAPTGPWSTRASTS